jgi:hypothetical protein
LLENHSVMKLPFSAPLVFVMTVVGCAAEIPPQVALRVTDGPVVALWQKAPAPNKPYIAQLFAPGDKPIPLLDDSPPDHFHHHGLMFAIGVDGTDFWAEKDIKNAGRQEVSESVAAPTGDGFTQSLRWLATDGTPLLDETRRVRVRATGKGAEVVHWLAWESVLTPAAGRDKVRLSGAHYFGLGMRFLPEWANQGEFIWSDPATPPAVGGEKVTPGDWCAVRCSIEGRPVTVLMLAHAANPRPGEWFTMSKPFCYLSATLNLKNEPFSMAQGQSWTLRYSLAVLSTPADHTRLSKLAEGWKNSNLFPVKEPSNPAKP